MLCWHCVLMAVAAPVAAYHCYSANTSDRTHKMPGEIAKSHTRKAAVVSCLNLDEAESVLLRHGASDGEQI